jgi:hypothetical protein
VFSLAPTILSNGSVAPSFLFQDTFSRTSNLLGSSPDFPSGASYFSYFPGGGNGDVSSGKAFNSNTTVGCSAGVNTLTLPNAYSLSFDFELGSSSHYVGIFLRAVPSTNSAQGVLIQISSTVIEIYEFTSPSVFSLVASQSNTIPLSTLLSAVMINTPTGVSVDIPALSISFSHTTSFVNTNTTFAINLAPNSATTYIDILQVL